MSNDYGDLAPGRAFDASTPSNREAAELRLTERLNQGEISQEQYDTELEALKRVF